MYTTRLAITKIVHLTAMAVSLCGLAVSSTALGGGVIHQVHVGGPDICTGIGSKPGCDKNFSLTAIQFADGSVKGQYTDRYPGGGQGFHANIDCLRVQEESFGKVAWVSGVITKGMRGDEDLAGMPVFTKVLDVATSANDDSHDLISYSWIGYPYTCNDQTYPPTIEVFQGQVTIK